MKAPHSKGIWATMWKYWIIFNQIGFQPCFASSLSSAQFFFVPAGRFRVRQSCFVGSAVEGISSEKDKSILTQMGWAFPLKHIWECREKLCLLIGTSWDLTFHNKATARSICQPCQLQSPPWVNSQGLIGRGIWLLPLMLTGKKCLLGHRGLFLGNNAARMVQWWPFSFGVRRIPAKLSQGRSGIFGFPLYPA